MIVVLRPGMAMPGRAGDTVVKAFPHTVVVRSTNGVLSIRSMPPNHTCPKEDT